MSAPLAGWGRFPVADCVVETPRDRAALAAALAGGDLIARGNGRAYGDAAMNRRRTLAMGRFDRLLAFDPATGRIEAEAGVLLADLIAAVLPRGWFPAVVPGTALVTLGGMIAADVHGKNHHRDGTLASATDWVEVLGPDGIARRAGPGDQLFDWTLGGMGLTGVILRAGLRLRPVETGWMRQIRQAVPDLAGLMAVLAQDDSAYSVGWIDALAAGPAHGLALLGDHAPRAELPPGMPAFPAPRRVARVPLAAPGWLLSRQLLRQANRLHYRRGAAAPCTELVDWQSFFFPLDRLADWNRLYGRRGFVQFQCVLPPETAPEGLAALLAATAAKGPGAFLAVLKRLGPGRGGLSFPMEGWTLALDLPMGPATPALLDRMDAITLDHGGRFYLAKDARMRAETLTRADPRVETLRALRRSLGWAPQFRSLQSERLEL